MVPSPNGHPGLSWRDREERTRMGQGQLRGKDWGNNRTDIYEVPDVGRQDTKEAESCYLDPGGAIGSQQRHWFTKNRC